MDKLKRIEVDLGSGTVTVNDTEVGNVDLLHLCFENGILKLHIRSGGEPVSALCGVFYANGFKAEITG